MMMALDTGQHRTVRVRLWPRLRMREDRSNEPLGMLPSDSVAAPTHKKNLLLDQAQNGFHRSTFGIRDGGPELGIARGIQDGHGLGRGQRDIDTGRPALEQRRGDKPVACGIAAIAKKIEMMRIDRGTRDDAKLGVAAQPNASGLRA